MRKNIFINKAMLPIRLKKRKLLRHKQHNVIMTSTHQFVFVRTSLLIRGLCYCADYLPRKCTLLDELLISGSIVHLKVRSIGVVAARACPRQKLRKLVNYDAHGET